MGSTDRFIERGRMDTAELEKWAKWVVVTCLTYGTTVSTAYKVAGLFVQQLEQDCERTHCNADY